MYKRRRDNFNFNRELVKHLKIIPVADFYNLSFIKNLIKKVI